MYLQFTEWWVYDKCEQPLTFCIYFDVFNWRN